MMRLASVLALLVGIVSNGSQERAVSPLPPHDYVLVVAPGSAPAGALSLIRNSVISTLRLSGILAAGYPQLGTTTETPSPTEKAVVGVSCSELYAGSPDADCIRFGPTSYVRFDVASHPDSRVHLFEVWLLSERPANAVRRQELRRVPRVVVEYPFVGGDLKLEGEGHARLLDVIQRGLTVAGAKPLTIE